MPFHLKLPSLFASRPRLTLAAFVIIALIALVGIPRLLGEKLVVLTATQGELTQSVVASGKVRSPQRVELTSQITGRVTQIPVREGHKVDAGQLLIQLDPAELSAGVAQSSAALAQSETRLAQMKQLALPLALQSQRQAEANRVQARQHFERSRELVARGFYSKTQLDDAQRNLDFTESQWQAAQLQARSNQAGGSDFRLAQVAVVQSRAGLELAQTRLAYATIAAPVSGTVLTRSVEPGDTAQPGKVLMTISPAGDTELIAQIDEKNLRLLSLGQKALASADAYPGDRFPAEINFISPAVDPLRGSVEIRLRVPEPPDFLRQEMTISIDIETARRADAVVVAGEAIRDAGSAKPWVFVVRDGRAQRQDVLLGVRSDGKVEILKGIDAGEQLIPASALSVREGNRVRAVAG
ncbi:efflux RND transporter periplasmic adaptor subunit [Propionivibrio sp.]|uniref:efflux RND transporter periplasmic adaptor subunit n=1 Tax=Propionivibrio sp. TaxID=2212460 RepID=UPI003BF259E1